MIGGLAEKRSRAIELIEQFENGRINLMSATLWPDGADTALREIGNRL